MVMIVTLLESYLFLSRGWNLICSSLEAAISFVPLEGWSCEAVETVKAILVACKTKD